MNSRSITIPCFGRWRATFAADTAVDRVVFKSPDGRTLSRPAFIDQPATIAYDDRGFEQITAAGPVRLGARFTPDAVGAWAYRACAGEKVIEEGTFDCVASAEPGFVEVSTVDPRYFRFTDGRPYFAIGLNLCMPSSYPLSVGREFATIATHGTMGIREYARWFRRLAENGGNFARLWLGWEYFQCQVDAAGEIKLLPLVALDGVVEEARKHGIRLKFCLEYFREFNVKKWTSRALTHPDGSTPASMDEWYQSDKWQSLWWQKVVALTSRYGDDPAVMAWELWNEIECGAVSDWSVPCEWTRKTLPKLKLLSPRNLVVNSLGSFDRPGQHCTHDDFKMDEMEFQQVHRYLDQGAKGLHCTDPVKLGVEAIGWARRPDRPVLLAETGAVNDKHSGPFRFYRWDDEGLIFHDSTYPSFFAGAAGSGHIWHWDAYVDPKNLWPGYAALAAVLAGVDPDRELFKPADLSTEQAWALLLVGRTVTLGWVRNRADTWQAVLRDQQTTAPLAGVTLDLSAAADSAARKVELFRPWPADAAGPATFANGRLTLPAFRHGVMFRIART